MTKGKKRKSQQKRIHEKEETLIVQDCDIDYTDIEEDTDEYQK